MPVQPVKIEINTATMHKEKGLERDQRDRDQYLKLIDSNDNRGDAAQPGDLHRDEHVHLLEDTYAVKQNETASDEHWLQALTDTRGRP
eukprot:7742433-Pyramimonas_sp.AAC.1